MIFKVREMAIRDGIDPEEAVAYVVVRGAQRGLELAQEEHDKAKRDYRDRNLQLERARDRVRAKGSEASQQLRAAFIDAQQRQRRATKRVIEAATRLDQWHTQADDAVRTWGPILYRAETRAIAKETEAMVAARLEWIQERKAQLESGVW